MSARWRCRTFSASHSPRGGEVLRVCSLIWRRGELIGARFVTAKELRQGSVPADADPKLQKAPVN
jgi:hypothetical protein